MIWCRDFPLEKVNEIGLGGMAKTLGIELTEVGDDYLKGKMAVCEKTTQPFGLLNGGASCALAETVGSVAAHFCIRDEDKVGVGMNLTASHVKSVSKGYVIATARPKHIGGRSQVWEVAIDDESGDLVCTVLFTVAVIKKPSQLADYP